MLINVQKHTNKPVYAHIYPCTHTYLTYAAILALKRTELNKAHARQRTRRRPHLDAGSFDCRLVRLDTNLDGVVNHSLNSHKRSHPCHGGRVHLSMQKSQKHERKQKQRLPDWRGPPDGYAQKVLTLASSPSARGLACSLLPAPCARLQHSCAHSHSVRTRGQKRRAIARSRTASPNRPHSWCRALFCVRLYLYPLSLSRRLQHLSLLTLSFYPQDSPAAEDPMGRIGRRTQRK